MGITMVARPKAWTTRDVAKLFEEAGFEVRVASRMADGVDFFAHSAQRGKRYGVVVESYAGALPVEVIRAPQSILKNGNEDLSEIWVIGREFDADTRDVARSSIRLRLLQTDEVLNAVFGQGETRPGASRLYNNRSEIIIALSAFMVLLDEKLADLHAERPNSDEAKIERDEAISSYSDLRLRTHALAEAVNHLATDEITEDEAEKTANSFALGVQNWWLKKHDKICEKALDIGLFGLAVSICSAAGAGGKFGVALSAAMVGGKQLGDALKSFKGIWK